MKCKDSVSFMSFRNMYIFNDQMNGVLNIKTNRKTFSIVTSQYICNKILRHHVIISICYTFSVQKIWYAREEIWFVWHASYGFKKKCVRVFSENVKRNIGFGWRLSFFCPFDILFPQIYIHKIFFFYIPCNKIFGYYEEGGTKNIGLLNDV